MPIEDILVQALGWIASALVVTAFWSRDDRVLNVLLLVGLAGMASHLAMLGAWTGAASCMCGALRSGAALRWHGSRPLALLFCAAAVVLAVPTWAGVTSALVVAAGVTSTFVLLLLSGARMRLAMAPISVLWLTHHIMVGSLPAVVMETMVMLGNIRGGLMLARAAQVRRALA